MSSSSLNSSNSSSGNSSGGDSSINNSSGSSGNRSLPGRSTSSFTLSTSTSSTSSSSSSSSTTSFTRMGSLQVLPNKQSATSKSTNNMLPPMMNGGGGGNGIFNMMTSSTGSNSPTISHHHLSHSSSSLLYEPLSNDEIRQPVYDIKSHIQQIDRIRQEFRLLEESTISGETSEGDKKHNTMKNRYTNILPCNNTRVILETKQGDRDGSDYINANFIDGCSTEKEYICTQGPLQNTILDFWRMIWENESSIIVMLSREQENCRPKCDRYWPDQLKDTNPNHWSEGKFKVQLTEVLRDDSREIIIRNLILYNIQTGESRPIYHYQYEGWPDHNAPQDTDALRHLFHLINSVQISLSPPKLQTRPIVVHCSAGVGRTGTFCTVHIIMKKLEKYYLKFKQHTSSSSSSISTSTSSSSSSSSSTSSILSKQQSIEKPQQLLEPIDFNLFNIVLNLRAQRPGMVQQFEQYIFCYQAISDEIDEKYSELFN